MEIVDVGTVPNDGTGDTLRAAMVKINANFAEIQVPGIDYTGVADSTAALNAAIAAAGASAVIRLGEGDILITSTVLIEDHRVHLVGAGPYATRIMFAPTADDTCISVTGGGSVLVQGSIRDLTIYSEDSTYTKIALDIEDTSGWRLQNIVVGGSVAVSGTSYWSGGTGSIGLATRGREFTTTSNLYITADKPIVIAGNPNSTIDSDHFHFEDTYLTANGAPCVTIADGVNLTQMTFDGANPWVKGTYALYWADSTTSGVSNGLTLRNVRAEQGSDANAYLVYISHNSNLQNLVLDSCYGGSDRKGIYLRKVQTVSFMDHFHSGATEALNVDSTVDHISAFSCYWLAGSTLAGTLSAMGQRLVWATPKNPSTGALPPDFVLQLASSTSRNLTNGGAIGEEVLTLASDGVATLGTFLAGRLWVIDSEGRTGSFECTGANNSVAEVEDVSTVFSHTKDNASTTNVYYDSGYKIQNKRGAERRYRLLMIGSYSSF